MPVFTIAGSMCPDQFGCDTEPAARQAHATRRGHAAAGACLFEDLQVLDVGAAEVDVVVHLVAGGHLRPVLLAALRAEGAD